MSLKPTVLATLAYVMLTHKLRRKQHYTVRSAVEPMITYDEGTSRHSIKVDQFTMRAIKKLPFVLTAQALLNNGYEVVDTDPLHTDHRWIDFESEGSPMKRLFLSGNIIDTPLESAVVTTAQSHSFELPNERMSTRRSGTRS